MANSTAYFVCGWGAVLGAQRGHTAMNIREAVLYKCISQHTDNPQKEGALWETSNTVQQYRDALGLAWNICFFRSQSVPRPPLDLVWTVVMASRAAWSIPCSSKVSWATKISVPWTMSCIARLGTSVKPSHGRVFSRSCEQGFSRVSESIRP